MRECENIVERLPDLLHERLAADERERVLSHVSACDDCQAELAWLRATREGLVAAAPRIDTAAIARAVHAQLASTPTLRLVTGEGAQPIARRARGESRPRWATTRLRAAAALVVVAAGAGAVVLSRGTADRPAPSVGQVARAPITAPTTPAAPSADTVTTPAPRASTPAPSPAPLTVASAEPAAPLGASFADLSDAELAAVIAAIDDEGGTLPADPAPTPNVVTPGGAR